MRTRGGTGGGMVEGLSPPPPLGDDEDYDPFARSSGETENRVELWAHCMGLTLGVECMCYSFVS